MCASLPTGGCREGLHKAEIPPFYFTGLHTPPTGGNFVRDM
jgi:hypothetical protein